MVFAAAPRLTSADNRGIYPGSNVPFAGKLAKKVHYLAQLVEAREGSDVAARGAALCRFSCTLFLVWKVNRNACAELLLMSSKAPITWFLHKFSR